MTTAKTEKRNARKSVTEFRGHTPEITQPRLASIQQGQFTLATLTEQGKVIHFEIQLIKTQLRREFKSLRQDIKKGADIKHLHPLGIFFRKDGTIQIK